ncbi:ferredoxin [Pseudonocardia alaniniphila]|uniref:Ferredoxin n=1 Tax=Pseudonocardia alaniniphila TaxID=75291 RepID=A0ABS9TBZ1_9PSEU|nr:ferredoxin [Pseudonocardia alaniniphila]MCH6166039.1 ferredoxin [Pseudonocardia alaniniphila]
MRILVDRDRCEGHGLCAGQASEVFELDEAGDLVYRFDGQDVPEELTSAAAHGASVCPVAALRVVH